MGKATLAGHRVWGKASDYQRPSNGPEQVHVEGTAWSMARPSGWWVKIDGTPPAGVPVVQGCVRVGRPTRGPLPADLRP